jgi:chemotaxis protein MotB
MARRKEAHGGGHGWFVTFADLMGLLVAFFVMLVAFSTQDQQKLQVVAGSMREAFGVQDKIRYSGIIEVLGLPTRPKLKNAAHVDPKDASATPSADEHDKERSYGARFKQDRDFALAAASLRQALQDMPEISESSKHIMVEETKEGLNIEIVDQDGRSMFADGTKEPFDRTRKLIQSMAPSLKGMPYRISITGHTATSNVPEKPGLRRLGAVRRPRQRGVPDSGQRGRALESYLHGCRQGRHRSAVS